MKIGINGINLIKHFESLQLISYKCPAGVWTIGYGHTKNVKPNQHITAQIADIYLLDDLKEAETIINQLNIKLTQNQYDSLVSFVFNCGAGNFGKSTLKKKLLINPCDPTIPAEFNKYVYGGGVVLNGLVNRRKKESDLYENII